MYSFFLIFLDNLIIIFIFIKGQGIMLGQWLHQKILRKHIELLGGEVELGCALTSIEQRENSVVAHLAQTVGGEISEETASFSYIIGADGAHSKLLRYSI